MYRGRTYLVFVNKVGKKKVKQHERCDQRSQNGTSKPEETEQENSRNFGVIWKCKRFIKGFNLDSKYPSSKEVPRKRKKLHNFTRQTCPSR